MRVLNKREPAQRFDSASRMVPSATDAPSGSSGGGGGSAESSGLPADLIAAAEARLGGAALLYGLTGFLAALVMVSTTWNLQTPASRNLRLFIHLVASVVSLALWWLCRRRRLDPRHVLSVGIAYEIVGGLFISAIESWGIYSPVYRPLISVSSGPSWICVWLIIFPLLVPVPPRRALIAALITASTGPLTYGFSWLFVGYSPELIARTGFPLSTLLVLAFYPNYLCAFMAWFASRVISRLGADIKAARQLGSYRLEERLGVGGMGEVWRASHRLLARPAAVKLVRPEAIGAAGVGADVIWRRFEREAQATAGLNSPHTVELYDFGVTDEGIFFYVMELLDGLDLETLVERHGPQPAARVVSILMQACDSLADAHASGLIHRDVKPANLYLCRKGHRHDVLKVLDFGLVRQFGATAAEARLTLDGMASGTPAYMPPEIIKGEEQIDARSDLYALGCVGYWLLSGSLVFEARSSLEMIMNHAQATPPPLTGRAKHPVPPELETVLMSCLEKDPARRPATADELGRRLAACGVSVWTEEDARLWWQSHQPRATPPGGVRTAALALLLALGLAAAAPVRPVVAAPRPAQVGFVLDGPWDRNAEILARIQQELRELAGPERPLEFPAELMLTADWTPAGVEAALHRELADERADVVVALGVLASDRACRLGPPPRPLVAPIILDPLVQDLPAHDGVSGVHNLTYLAVPAAVQRDIQAFRSLVPFHRLTVLGNAFVAAEMPQVVDALSKSVIALGLSVTVVPVRGSAAQALASLPGDAEAVYLLPLLQLTTPALDSLITGLNARRLPTFSALGEREVARGVLAGVSPDIFPPLSRRLAVVVQRILSGEDPATIPTAFTVGARLTLNLHTARTIQFNPTWADLAEANLIGDERRLNGRPLTFVGALREAEAVNLDLLAQDRSVAAGAQLVNAARAALWPQVDLSSSGLLIDSDRAAASFGSQAERTLSSGVSVTQVLYSEPALARLAVERANQRGRLGEREQTRLDLVRATGGAYLQVLRAITLERIRRENLRLTREHLELARLRESVGSSRLSDVYRWESELATNRKAAIEANAARNLAEIELNRLLHRPAEERFVTADLSLDSTDVKTFLDLCAPYFRDRLSLRRLRGFLAAEAVRRTPEIVRIDAGLAAARRTLASAERSFYQPSLALSGSLSQQWADGGAGSGAPAFPGLPARALPAADDLDWNLGVKLSFPLFHGGEIVANRSRARAEVGGLEARRAATAERVEERARAAVHEAGASYAGIREAQSAADWASRNLDLVGEAYARGAVSFIDLLDAQNAHVVAEQGAADAVYGFLDDLLEVQRAIGRFGYAMTLDERSDFSRRLKQFAEQAGAGEE